MTVGVAAVLEPRVRRAYFECRYGQLHVHYAIPAGGGFDEATTLLCIPGAAGQGRFFRPLLLPLGRDRSVYAPDLPGCGESDPSTAEQQNLELQAPLRIFWIRCICDRSICWRTTAESEWPSRLPTSVLTRSSRVVLSPNTDSVRSEARALRQPQLLIDLRPADAGGHNPAELERQAAQLRDFLGLA